MAWAIAIAAFVIIDLVVMGAVIGAVMAPLRELAGRFPARIPAPDAVRRDFQSFQIGMVGAGLSIHVAADDAFLHLSPAWVMRLFGLRPLSVPWESITAVSVGKRHARVRVEDAKGKLEIKGPAWCLKLAGEAR